MGLLLRSTHFTRLTKIHSTQLNSCELHWTQSVLMFLLLQHASFPGFSFAVTSSIETITSITQILFQAIIVDEFSGSWFIVFVSQTGNFLPDNFYSSTAFLFNIDRLVLLHDGSDALPASKHPHPRMPKKILIADNLVKYSYTYHRMHTKSAPNWWLKWQKHFLNQINKRRTFRDRPFSFSKIIVYMHLHARTHIVNVFLRSPSKFARKTVRLCKCDRAAKTRILHPYSSTDLTYAYNVW